MKSLYFILAAALLISGAGYYVYQGQQDKTSPPASAPTSTETPATTKNTGIQQIKSLHFETASPDHNEVYAVAPYNVVIDFNFDLADNSKITIEKDGVDYGEGATTIDPKERTLRRLMKQNAPDGIYTIKYTACWPDRSCHDGLHAFTIDSSQLSKYTDLTGKGEVTVDLNNLVFSPAYIVVSKNTKVNWINRESATHYVNADPHAGHSFVLAWNSDALERNDKYSFMFANVGEFPYHCSAHYPEGMRGRVIVK
jgi:plastocyanin